MKARVMSRQNREKREVLHKILPLQAPFRVQVEPSGLCNQKCVFCAPHQQGGQSRGLMERRTFQLLLSQLKEFPVQVKILNFCGYGEPLLHKEIALMLKQARQACIAEQLTLTTNGTLLTPETSESLIDAGLSSLEISVAALTEENFSRIANCKVDMQSFIDNIKFFSSIKKDCNLYIKIGNLAIADEDDEKRFYETYGNYADKIFIENITTTWAESDIGLKYNGRDIYGDKIVHKEICTQPFKFLLVCSDGMVLPCCADWTRKLALGNIKTERLLDIWNGKSAQLMRDFLLQKKKETVPCNQCHYPVICDGLDNIDGHENEILLRMKTSCSLMEE